MSADEDTELRDLVAQTLEANGILNKLRAELRANVFLALEEQDALQNKKVDNVRLKRFLDTKDGRLAMSLVRELLVFFNLDFTVAVLEPEIGQSNKLSSREELMKEFNLKDTSNPVLTGILKSGGKSGALPPSSDDNTKPVLSEKLDKGNKNKLDWLNPALTSTNLNDVPVDSPKTAGSLGSLKSIPPLPGLNKETKLIDSPILDGSGSWEDLLDIEKKISDLGFEIPKGSDGDNYEDDFQPSSSRKSDDGLSITEEIEEDISIGSFAESKGDDPVTTDHTVSQMSDTGYDYMEVAELR